MPEVASAVVPYSVAAILGIACVQVSLFAIARLLAMVAQEAVFTTPALKWVNLIIGCAAVFALLTFVVAYHLATNFGGPAALYLIAVAVVGLIIALLMRVMRELLVKATANQAELAEVI